MVNNFFFILGRTLLTYIFTVGFSLSAGVFELDTGERIEGEIVGVSARWVEILSKNGEKVKVIFTHFNQDSLEKVLQHRIVRRVLPIARKPVLKHRLYSRSTVLRFEYMGQKYEARVDRSFPFGSPKSP